MLGSFIIFFFVQNLLTSWGMVLIPLDKTVSGEKSGRMIFGLLGLFLVLASLWMYLVDWLLCGLLGLEFLRVFLLFLNLALFNALAPVLGNRFPGAAQGTSWAEYKLLNLDVIIMGFMLLATGRHYNFLEFGGAVLGALTGCGAALVLHSQILRHLELEWLPPAVRGKPLAFFALGLVSMIFVIAGLALQPMLSASGW